MSQSTQLTTLRSFCAGLQAVSYKEPPIGASHQLLVIDLSFVSISLWLSTRTGQRRKVRYGQPQEASICLNSRHSVCVHAVELRSAGFGGERSGSGRHNRVGLGGGPGLNDSYWLIK